ncbi:DUF1178 family protein [Xylophilus sp. GOD-11R]|uniref:DUF1178 family protein n=1 Tax=Xylophilus sp. GOD-11R TaxID=3089814 RepID=UPI00298C3965|nr:DUF1178 family protein [Xylophilus sp. GOD-11R]WPB59093.1 DUF1178 family protein [Xylophilus sp. GOD-11R]
MKVLDLRCGAHHAFEGWFGSEDDFRDQLGRGLVTCPVCSDSAVVRMPSAPRLNLSGSRSGNEMIASRPTETESDARPKAAASAAELGAGMHAARQAELWKMAREAVRNTEDVGARFAEEARRIHHGETQARGIRGHATGEQVRELLEEGVGIVALPDALKETLQ